MWKNFALEVHGEWYEFASRLVALMLWANSGAPLPKGKI
jgi:hypothetical protein